jgi:predicted dehydrogenase
MSQKVRVGIIGTSWWTETMFLASFKSHISAEITAICGRNQDRAQELAGEYGIPHVFSDYRALLEQPNLDAVVVATPDDLHYPMTMDALDVGLHVLCEKPMALNAQDAWAMYEKAEAARVKHMVLFTWRWQPDFLFLKRLVDGGYVGHCYQAYFSFLGPFGREPEYQWRFDSQRSNGVISDLGAHMIDFARWYLGDVRKVSAHLATFIDRPDVEGKPSVPVNDSAVVTLQFDHGTQAVIQVSAMAHKADRGVDINILLHGASGSLEAEHIFFGSEARVKVLGARHDEEVFGRLAIPDDLQMDLEESDPFDPYVKHSAGPRLFIDAILEDRSVSPNFYDGFKVQEVIDATLESHQNKCWVSLDPTTPS